MRKSWRSTVVFAVVAALLIFGAILAMRGARPARASNATQGSHAPGVTQAATSSDDRNPGVVPFQHVLVVMEENQNYSSVIGSSSMPYLNSLADTYAYSNGYFANTHPSIGNYFMITTGQIITNDDNFGGTVDQDNIVRHLIAAGLTWKEYSESLPYQGYDGGNNGEYAQRHDPLSYFSDVRNSPTQQQNLVPFTQFATDLANNALPNYSFIVPNLIDDGHDCPPGNPNCPNSTLLADIDAWLQTNIAPLVENKNFQTPGNGLLIITFDESGNDNNHGGGQVAWVAVGPNVKKAYTSTTFYQHPNTLQLMCTSIGLNACPFMAVAQRNMQEFVQPN